MTKQNRIGWTGMQFFCVKLRINSLRSLLIGMFICLNAAEKLAFAIAGKAMGLLININAAKTKINYPAKLGKKEDEKYWYRDISFQWI